ncbi:MAG: hypothetical protein Q9170_001963 [Blastenia crenularia]
MAVPGERTQWDDIIQNIEKSSNNNPRLRLNEKPEMSKNTSVSLLASKAIALDSVAIVIRGIPDIQIEVQPLGVGTTIGAVIVNISDAIAMGAGIMRTIAQVDIDVASRAARKAELVQQLQERRMEANAAGRGVKVTDRQIATMQVRLAMCEEEIKQKKRAITHAAEMNGLLRSKYTNEQLFAWMDGQIQHIMYRTFLLANDLAKKAQELLALFSLQETGIAEFPISETLLDFEFPGHSFRCIKTVSVSISGSVDPTPDLDSTPTLLEHRYRVSLAAATGVDYLPKTGGADDKFRIDQIPIASIAAVEAPMVAASLTTNSNSTTTIATSPSKVPAQSANGALNPLCPSSNSTTNNISDVVIQLKYTANSGGARSRKAASDAARALQTSVTGLAATEGLFAVIDLKSDFLTQWTTFTQTTATARSVTFVGVSELSFVFH